MRVLTLGVFIFRYDYDRCQGSPTAAQKPEKLKTKSVQMKTKIPLISKNCWDEREKKRKTTFEMKTLKVKGWFVFFFAPGVVFFLLRQKSAALAALTRKMGAALCQTPAHTENIFNRSPTASHSHANTHPCTHTHTLAQTFKHACTHTHFYLFLSFKPYSNIPPKFAPLSFILF